MTAKEHNVDICVTCVCEKPPQLPLREELPSLGIELVYNAKGAGAEAAEEQRQNEIDKIKKKKQQQKQKEGKKAEGAARWKRSTRDPPSRSPFPVINFKSGRHSQKEDPPEDFPTTKALSYGKYQQKLELLNTSTGDASISSTLETTSTMNENCPKEKKAKSGKLLGLFSRKKKNETNEPPMSVEIPHTKSAEDVAVQEAFKAFMSNDEDDVPAKKAFDALPPPKEGIKQVGALSTEKMDDFPDLLPGSKNNPEQVDTAFSRDTRGSESEGVQGSSLEQTTISSLGEDSSPWKNDVVNDAESFTKRAKDMLKKMAAERALTPSGGGNIKVKLLTDQADKNHITELYDLTEVSENGNDYLQEEGAGMGMRDDDYNHKDHYNSYTHQQFVAETRHQFQDVFPDSSDNEVIYHGSAATNFPNVFDFADEESSVPLPEIDDELGNPVIDLADVYEEDGPGSPLVLSPVQVRRTADSSAFSPASFPQFQQKAKPNPFLPSFYHNEMRNGEILNQDRRDDVIVYRAERQLSPNLREKNTSPLRLDVADSYRSPSSRARKPGMKMPTFDEAVKKYYDSRGQSHLHSVSPSSPHITPAIRKSVSRDSHDSSRVLKVTFSQDLEEHYFDKTHFNEERVHGVESSLAAILNEEQGLNEPLPSALSREADEAFQSFANQLEEEDDSRTPHQMLLEALSFGDPLPFDFEETIQLNPSIASRRLPDADTFALHAACSRAFPKRFGKDQTCRINDLIDDLVLHRKLIEALVTVDPETCRRVDENGDLPVHIMARQLMEWEGRWYQKVYDKARNKDEESDSVAGITKLYESMSECINVLLQPITQDDALCLQSGSVGRILPLHIAAIFTVPYNTLRSLLETFPNAASTKCDLSNIKTFVPNYSTPLELHDRLSTDFPKWEIQKVDFRPDEEMTQTMLDKVYGTTNGIRRSDLLFAFFPKLLPYRKESFRIRRMEQMIQNEMKYKDTRGNHVLTRSAEAFWIWLCEFQGKEDVSDHYAESVSRIVNRLPYQSVRFLASINEGGTAVLDKAIPPCSDVIMEKLYTISTTEIPIRLPLSSRGTNDGAKKSLLQQFDEENSRRFQLHGQGFVGSLCRTIFHVQETTYPSSFVLLPYKLVKDNKGGLGLESPRAAKVAMEFAGHLSRVTAPKNIVHILDRKIDEFVGCDLVDKMNRENRESQRKRNEYFDEFLKLYENEPAYFYFIDDCTGVPIVDDNHGVYPLVVSDAVDVVGKVFPLMLSGLILMRGEKALSILAEVLLDENIKLVLPHWIEAAKDLVGYASSSEAMSPSWKNLLPLRQKLINFVQYGSTESDVAKKFRNGGLSSEWVVEISLIKMMIEMHDSRHNFCDLSQTRSTTQVLWTRKSDLRPELQSQIDFIPPKTLKALLNGNERTNGRNDFFDDKEYDDLFEDDDANDGSSKMTNEGGSNSSTGEYTESTSEDDMPGMIITTSDKKNSRSVTSQLSDQHDDQPPDHLSYDHLIADQQRPDPPPAGILRKSDESDESAQERSFSTDDESFALRSVLKLRFQLDEQESKLKSLRKKIVELDTVGDQLILQEEKITDMISEIINQKDEMLQSSTSDGLMKAKALMMRICELEDRVLCREIEVGQLKNDVSFFELEASDQSESSGVDDTNFSRRSAGTEDDPEDNLESPDEDINSDQDEDSSVGNSTMYNSSLDGYPAGTEGYRTGVLNQ